MQSLLLIGEIKLSQSRLNSNWLSGRNSIWFFACISSNVMGHSWPELGCSCSTGIILWEELLLCTVGNICSGATVDGKLNAFFWTSDFLSYQLDLFLCNGLNCRFLSCNLYLNPTRLLDDKSTLSGCSGWGGHNPNHPRNADKFRKKM